MLGVELAKIMLARFLANLELVQVYVLTFNVDGLNYEQLNEELKQSDGSYRVGH